MSAGVEGNKRLHARPPARPTSRMLAAEAAAAVNLALSPEAKEAEAARHHPTPDRTIRVRPREVIGPASHATSTASRATDRRPTAQTV